MSSYFLTTAIDYVNGKPHLGHAYEKVLADVIARYRRNRGDNVLFLTGVDEHGQKVQQSAQSRGISPREYCDEMSMHFRAAWQSLTLSHDRFVRTTDESHQAVVRASLQKLWDAGLIRFQEHEGYYSVRQEQFVMERDKVDGAWPEIFGEVVAMKEPNYFFRLSAFQEWLRDFMKERTDFIVPAFRRNEVLQFLERPLEDLCISRPKARLSWGIPLPFDEQFVTYVWFDALLNYASFAGWGTSENRWPADLHVIGKDILVPSHAIYWPIMLKALDMEMPRQILVHGWWQIEGAKMSKTTGRLIDTQELVEPFGSEAVRYFVMRDMVVGYDADFSMKQFETRYRSDLANDLGNLVNRNISMIHRFRDGVVPEAACDPDIAASIDATLRDAAERMDRFEIHQALERIWKLVTRGNQYVDENAPWKLNKDPAATGRLDQVLLTLAELCRAVSVMIEPVLPITAARIQRQLGFRHGTFVWSEAQAGNRLAGQRIGTADPLFPRGD